MMPQNDDVRFISSSVKLPSFSPPPNCQPHFFFSFQLTPLSKFVKLPFNFNPQRIFRHKLKTHLLSDAVFKKAPLFCSASLALADNSESRPTLPQSRSDHDSGSVIQQDGDSGGVNLANAVGGNLAVEEERVLISEVQVRSKDGEELQRKQLEAEALNALQASGANSALTAREVQEDVHRIVASGYFMSCMPVAVDTCDGIRLIFQVEPNEDFQGLVCEGANVLPSKFVEDAFRGGYGKIINIRHLDEVISSIDSWYMERGLFGMVSGVEILSGGILKLQVSEANVNNIFICFLDKNGEPTVGKTWPETITRQLTMKKGQVFSTIQGRRDVETVLAMGIMDDVSIIPQPADTCKVDLTMNVVERKRWAGISGGGGVSSGITGGPLAGLIGSIIVYHKNLFGRNQKLNLSLERGQINSMFRINYIDPWIEGDDKRTSRTIMVQNSRTPTLIHGNQTDDDGLTIGRIAAGIEYSLPFRPKWNGTAGLIFQRAGPRDERGTPVARDFPGSPLTASGNADDDMLLAKLETIYSSAGGKSSSMFACNLDQGLPVSPEWLVFSRVNARARQGFVAGPLCFLVCFSGGHMVGKFPPHEAFPIGGTNSVRGYEEGAVGYGRTYGIGSGEILFPLMGPIEGAIFADYGTDLGSGQIVPGDLAGAQNKPGSGYGYGIGIRVNAPFGPIRLEYAFNDQGTGRFHFGIGLQN